MKGRSTKIYFKRKMEKDLKIFIAVFIAGLLMVGVFSFNTGVQADDKTQTLNLAVTSTITFNLATTTVALGTLTPGSAIISTTSCTITTNAANGWQLLVKRNNATATLMHSDLTTAFPDATAWNGSNANISPGSNLSFRVYQGGTTAGYNATWWGSDDAQGNAKWAGFPTASVNVATTTSYAASAATVVYGFRVDAPATQKTGTYTGGITLTALAQI